MNEIKFDRFAKSLAVGRSRRDFVKAAEALADGGAAVTAVPGITLAQETCSAEGESCENCDCCDGLACSDDLACYIPDEAVTGASTGGTTTVTIVPDTGSGSAAETGSSVEAGIVVAAGAAAAAGYLLHKRNIQATEVD